MFTAVDYPDQNLLKFTIANELTKADYASVAPILAAKVQRWGKVNVYLEINELEAITLPALWQEIKLDFQHFTDFSRTAVVSDESFLLQAASAVADFVVPGETKHFTLDQKTEALAWTLGADPAQLTTKQLYPVLAS